MSNASQQRDSPPSWFPDDIQAGMMTSIHNGKNMLGLSKAEEKENEQDCVLNRISRGGNPLPGGPKLIVDASGYEKSLPDTAISIQDMVGRNVLVVPGQTNSITTGSTQEDIANHAWNATILRGPPNKTVIYWNQSPWGFLKSEIRLTTEGECKLAFFDGIIRKDIDHVGDNGSLKLTDRSRENWHWCTTNWSPQQSHALPVLIFHCGQPVLFLGYAD